MNKKTLIVGASENPQRYAFKAAKMLSDFGHDIVLFGKSGGQFNAIEIQKKLPDVIPDLHTITLYINPTHQEALMDKLIALAPKRILFNPGTENPIFAKKAQNAGIQTEDACTLVLLSTDQF